MQPTQLVRFREHVLEMLVVEGRPAFTAEAVGQALEYANPRTQIGKVFRRYRDEFEEGSDYLRGQFGLAGQRREALVFFQTGVNLIGMFSKQPLARQFRSWAKRVLATTQAAQSAVVPAAVEQSTISVPVEEYVALLKDKIALLEKHNQPRRVPITQAESSEIIRLHAAGHSNREIATAMKRSIGTIQNFLYMRRKSQKEA